MTRKELRERAEWIARMELEDYDSFATIKGIVTKFIDSNLANVRIKFLNVYNVLEALSINVKHWGGSRVTWSMND